MAETVERVLAGRTRLYGVSVRCGSDVVVEFQGSSSFVQQPAG